MKKFLTNALLGSTPYSTERKFSISDHHHIFNNAQQNPDW
jgi:hypothetical protein